MPFFASFDHAQPQPQPITGWYDTTLIDYGANLPLPEDILEVSEAEWAARMSGQFAHDSGSLVPYIPPVVPPTPAQEARALMVQPVQIVCTSVPDLQGMYAIDEKCRQAMGNIVGQITAKLGLPGGGGLFNWPDVEGNPKMWPADKFTAFSGAVRDFVYHCNQTAEGYSQVVPSNVLNIDAVVFTD